MNRYRVLTLLFFIFMLITGCSTSIEDIDVASQNDSCISFEELYMITDDYELNGLHIIKMPYLSTDKDSDTSKEADVIKLDKNIENELYKAIIGLQLKNVEPSIMGESKEYPSYIINLSLKHNEERYGYNIIFGNAYINMELLHNNDNLLYVHDISISEYDKIVELLQQ